MSKEALQRIERTLAGLCERQEEIQRQLARLGERVECIGGGARGATLEETVRFLDRFRAGEALGEASLGAWVAVCKTECLRGGLRTVQMREGMHARLLEQRLKELGASPSYEIPESVHERVMADSGDADKPDARKVAEFVERFPDCDAAVKPIFELADRLDDDPETQSLLRTIAQDERSTLEFLHEACAQLNPA